MSDDPTARSSRRTESSQTPASQLSAEWMKQWEQSVSKWWDTTIEDPAFTGSMGEALAGRARMRTQQSQAAQMALDQLNLPSRSDLVRLAKIASMLEDRLVALEDRLADTTARLDRMEKEAIRGRIELAEALIRIEDRLSPEQPPPPPKPKPKRRG